VLDTLEAANGQQVLTGSFLQALLDHAVAMDMSYIQGQHASLMVQRPYSSALGAAYLSQGLVAQASKGLEALSAKSMARQREVVETAVKIVEDSSLYSSRQAQQLPCAAMMVYASAVIWLDVPRQETRRDLPCLKEALAASTDDGMVLPLEVLLHRTLLRVVAKYQKLRPCHLPDMS